MEERALRLLSWDNLESLIYWAVLASDWEVQRYKSEAVALLSEQLSAMVAQQYKDH